MLNKQMVVIVIGVLITFWASSIKGSYQVYFLDLVQLSGVSRGQFALSSSIFGLAIGVFSPFVGWVSDRLGPALTILSGGLTASVAFLLMALPFHFWSFVLLFGVLAAYSLCAMTFVPLAVLVDRIFAHQNKGMAYAAITNGTAIGFMVLSPLWVWLHGFVSWQTLSIAIAAVFILMILPAMIVLCVAFPKQTFASSNDQAAGGDTPWLYLLRQPLFLLLALSFGGCGASMAYIDVHLVPLLQERFIDGAPVVVATSLSVLGAAELLGAFAVGYLLRFSPAALMLACLYGLRALSLGVLLYADTLVAVLLFAVVFGLSYMGTVIATSLICLQAYGAHVKGKIFGCLFSVHQVFVFAIIWLGGVSYDMTGSYQWITYVVIGLSCVSVWVGLLLWRVRVFNTVPQSGALS
ncbi:MFS transporter [Marinomonas sp. FW-1]|uniref:MFS transporter n=1 Tax=Marinomonas sp. FW-1 TaxID=2071621 RepID=UPI0010BFA452|nr:MFS transporter [Marinomonas sp. FW-1]